MVELDHQEQNTMESLEDLMKDWIPQPSSQIQGENASIDSMNVESRLCLKNVPKNLTKTDIQDFYQVTAEKIHFPKWQNDVDNKQHAMKMIFIQFSSRSDAETAKNQINSNKTTNIRASFAEKPKQKKSSSKQSTATTNSNRCPSTASLEPKKQTKSKDLVGSCERCGLDSRNVCDVCGSFYCSASCQRKDWLTHKLICKPMPKLVAAREKFGSTSDSNSDEESIAIQSDSEYTNVTSIHTTSETTQKNKFTVPFVDCTIIKNAIVVITAITSVNRLYVRVVGGDYKKLVAEITDYASKAKKQESFPEVDDVVLAPFEEIFYRAQILSIDNTPDANGNDLVVLFIDYGNISKVSSKNLKKLDYKHRALKRHAFRVTLSDVNSSITANEDSMCFLNSLLTNKEKLVVSELSSNQNDKIVTLLKESTGENVNKTIVNLSIVQEVSDYDEIMMCDDVKTLPLPLGRETVLFTTDVSLLNYHYVSCAPADVIPELCKIKKTIEEYGFRTKDMKYSPIKDEMCLVIFEKSWYRAYVMEQGDNSDTFELYLVDYCRSIANVSNENIRKMPKQFCNPAPKAHQCTISGSHKSEIFRKQAKDGMIFTVTSIEVDSTDQYILKF
ncbi:unnamed protein product [Diamesa serratosioi]